MVRSPLSPPRPPRFMLLLFSMASVLSAQSGGIVGRVVSNETGEPLGYSIISLTKQGSAFFASDSGRFSILNLAPGPLEIEVRRLGYTPSHLTAHITAGISDTVTVRLSRVAFQLGTLTVRASPVCKTPGAPSIGDDSTLMGIFGQLRQNADQYRFLTEAYPFQYVMDVQQISRLTDGTNTSSDVGHRLVRGRRA